MSVKATAYYQGLKVVVDDEQPIRACFVEELADKINNDSDFKNQGGNNEEIKIHRQDFENLKMDGDIKWDED